MSLKYIKHDREVTDEMLAKFGKLATHDLEIDALLLWDKGKTTDANGNVVNLDKNFIHKVFKATNDWIINKKNEVLSKLNSNWDKSIDDIHSIAFIKNHDTSDVDSVVGKIKGLTRIEEVDGKTTLQGKAIITDEKAKVKILKRELMNLSAGIRANGSIQEISFVVNEAVSHCSLLFSEYETSLAINNTIQESINQHENQNQKDIQLAEHRLQLSEQIEYLTFQLNELNNKTIPNHMLLSKMIKNNQIEPYKYNTLINQDNETILILSQNITKRNLGIMYSVAHPIIKLDDNEEEKLNKIRKEIYGDKSQEINITNKTLPIIDKILQDNINLEECRNKELKHILELSEYSPDIAKQYIKIELGDTQEQNKDNDIYLSEYILKSNDIKYKINNLNIQLGEYK